MQFVLVSAANANDLKLNRTFEYCAERRQAYLLGQYRGKDDVVVTWFDVTSGICQQVKMDKKGSRSKPVVLKRYKKVTRASYEPYQGGWRFRDGQKDAMSIVDVYRFVEDQAKDNSKSVHELSVFAHAWDQGPVLVDSYDNGHYKDDAGNVVWIKDNSRDPDDKDARLKDFEPLNRNLPKFQAAFNPAGAIRNWGCLHTDRDVELLKILVRHKDYKRTGMKDGQMLTLDIHKTLEGMLIGRLPVKNRKLTIAFGDLRRYFHGQLVSCYTAKAAEGAQVKAYGGAPGTGSVPASTGQAPMLIVASPGHNKQIVEFHKEYLDVQFDAAFYAEYPAQGRPFTKRP